MIVVMRIHGIVNMKEELEETMQRLRLQRKLVCTIIDEKDKVEMGMLKNITELVSYGTIKIETLKKMIVARGKTLDGKKVNEKDVDKIVQGIEKGEWKIKKYFRLHPPIGGFRKSTKQLPPRGILGENKAINELIERML